MLDAHLGPRRIAGLKMVSGLEEVPLNPDEACAHIQGIERVRRARSPR